MPLPYRTSNPAEMPAIATDLSGNAVRPICKIITRDKLSKFAIVFTIAFTIARNHTSAFAGAGASAMSFLIAFSGFDVAFTSIFMLPHTAKKLGDFSKQRLANTQTRSPQNRSPIQIKTIRRISWSDRLDHPRSGSVLSFIYAIGASPKRFSRVREDQTTAIPEYPFRSPLGLSWVHSVSPPYPCDRPKTW